MPGAGGAMTQTFYRLFGYALLDNRSDSKCDRSSKLYIKANIKLKNFVIIVARS